MDILNSLLSLFVFKFIRTSYHHETTAVLCALVSCRQQVNNDHVGYSIKTIEKQPPGSILKLDTKETQTYFPSINISHLRNSILVRTQFYSSPKQIFHRTYHKFPGLITLRELSSFVLLSWIYSSDSISRRGSNNSVLTTRGSGLPPLQRNRKASINRPRKMLLQKEFSSTVQTPKHIPFLAVLVTWQTLVTGWALQSCFRVGKQWRLFPPFTLLIWTLHRTSFSRGEELRNGLVSDLVPQ